MKVRGWAIALALLAAAQANAQTKKELVQKVLALQQPGIEGMARGIAAQTSNQMLQAMRQPLARVPQDKRDELRKQLQSDVKAFYDEIEPTLRKKAVEVAPVTLGSVYEERFSEAELKQLIAWLESPVAKKFQTAQPEMQNAMIQKILAETGPALEPKLKALQETLRKRFAAAAPAAAASPAASAAKK